MRQKVTEMELAREIVNALNSKGHEYTIREDEYGIRIENSSKGMKIFISREVRPDKKRNIVIENIEGDGSIEPILQIFEKYGIQGKIDCEKTQEKSYGVYFLNLVSYDDLGFPEELREELVSCGDGDATLYNKNGITVKRLKEFPEELYYYLGREQIARVTIDLERERVLDIQQNHGESKELLMIAVAITEDLLFREHIMRRFGIDPNSKEVQNYRNAYELNKKTIKRLRNEYNTKKRLPGWETTDPRTHDPYYFRYIVHAIASDEKRSFIGAQHAQFNASGLGITSEDSCVDPIEKPEEFVRRKYISCSIIDECHYGTWDAAGFILGVPPENIIQAAPYDMGIIPSDNMGYGSNPLPTAQDILTQTDFTSYNEVLIRGINPETGKQITIEAGFFVIDPITERPLNPEMAYKVGNFCSQHKLPIIPINRPLRI